MLFAHMPLWLFVVFLAVCFVVKQFAAERFQKSEYYQTNITGLGWTAVLNTSAAMNGLLTFGIFFLFTGLSWALVLGVIDASFHWLSGYYAKRKHLPILTQAKLLSAWNAIRALHAGSYMGFITIVIQYLMPTLAK